MVFRKKSFLFTIISIIIIISLSSCGTEKILFVFNRVNVKNYPDTPFVYSNTIKFENHLSKDETVKLTEDLGNYWADSLLAPRVMRFGAFYNLKKPPALDTGAITATKKLMKGYLFTQGYFNAGINILPDTINFSNGNKLLQQRAYITASINTGKKTLIDSVEYKLKDSSLLQLTQSRASQSFIEPGKTTYSKQLIASELDRLVAVYRNNGYYMLRRENLIADVDTSDASLFKLTLDPFEQAELIAKAEERKNKNPTCIVNFTQRRFIDSSLAGADSLFLRKFYIGKVSYFPETKLNGPSPDSLLAVKDFYTKAVANDFAVYGKEGQFKPVIFKDYSFIKPDSLYSDEKYYKTVNNLNQIGAWRQIETRFSKINDTIDVTFFLYPERKHNITYNLEASRNTGDFLSSSNLFGVSINVGYRDRNVWHRAIQSNTNLNVGEEFSFDQNTTVLQSFQVTAGQTYSIPRLIMPDKIIKNCIKPDFGRTLFNANLSYAERSNFFRIRSAVVNSGWEWKHKNDLWQLRPLNIEIYSLTKLPLLEEAIKQNPFLGTSFLTGSVSSMQLSYTHSSAKPSNPNINNYYRGSFEGTYPLGVIKSFNDNFYQYIKLEGEYRLLIKLQKTSLAFRTFAGIGYNYGNNTTFGSTLPFFKQFVAGGPNSMRAWGLRLLGQGSSLKSDTSSTFRDRYGDMQLEFNAEYRYPIAHFSAVDIKGAFFTDIGNIWNIRKDTSNPGGEFNFNKLGKDIAIGMGTGIRFDFSYFLIRIDFGIKFIDPARLEHNGLDFIKNFTWLNKEYVKYDSTGVEISPKRKNYSVQLGIGLPF